MTLLYVFSTILCLVAFVGPFFHDVYASHAGLEVGKHIPEARI